MAKQSSPRSYQAEQILQHVEGLLDRWGEYMRDEPPAGVKGYSARNTVARAMDEWGERSKNARRNRNPEAWRPTKRKISVGQGKSLRFVPVLDLLERPVRETRTMARPIAPPWPEDVQWTERLLARMPRDLLNIVAHHYYYRSSLRIGATANRISVHEYRRRLERAQWLVAGQLLAETG